MVNIDNNLSTACHSINVEVQPKESRHIFDDNITKIENVCKGESNECSKSSRDVEQVLDIKLRFASAKFKDAHFRDKRVSNT